MLKPQVILSPEDRKKKSLLDQVAAPVAQPEAQQPLTRPRSNRSSGPSLLDTIWGMAAGYSPGTTRRRIAAEERDVAAKERMMEAQRGLANYFGGGAGGGVGAPPPVGAPQAATANAFDPRAATPMLLQAAAAGVDISDYMRALDMGRPDVEIVNGVAVDKRDTSKIGQRVGGVDLTEVNGNLLDLNDARNTGRFVPEVGPGMELVYDAAGNPRAIPVPGYGEAMGANAGAVEAGKLDAANPRTLTTVTDSTGRTVTAPISTIIGQGGVVGADPIDQERRRREGEQEVTREGEFISRGDTARSTLRTLSNMKRILPDVISGLGAGATLQAARGLAAMGNARAQKQVEASQIFESQAGNLVLDIISSFGANPSNAEREYATKMSAADRVLSPETLAEGVRLAEAKAIRDIVRADEVLASRGDRAASARLILHQRGRNPYEVQ